MCIQTNFIFAQKNIQYVITKNTNINIDKQNADGNTSLILLCAYHNDLCGINFLFFERLCEFNPDDDGFTTYDYYICHDYSNNCYANILKCSPNIKSARKK